MSHRYGLDRFRNINKKKLVVAAIFIGIMLIAIIIVVGAIAAAIISALLSRAGAGSIGQGIGNVVQAGLGYTRDFISALWQQIIANPLQFINGRQ